MSHVDGAPEPAASRSGRPTPHARRVDRFVAVAFVVALLVPGATLLSGATPELIDNRPLLTFPPFSPGALLDADWYAGIGAALVDRLPIRPPAVTARAAANLETGGTGTAKVFRGTDGWFFYARDLSTACGVPAASMVADLTSLADRFRAAGQTFRVAIVPNKTAVYRDRLPSWARSTGCSDRSRPALRAMLAANPTLGPDLWSLLDAARTADPSGPLLYYPSDTHWTPTGAAIGIRAIVDPLAPGLWDPSQVVTDPAAPHAGDLGVMIGTTLTDDIPTVRIRPDETVTSTAVDPQAAAGARTVTVFRSSGSLPVVEGRTLIVHDSSFAIVAPNLAPFFRDSTWIAFEDLADHPGAVAALGPFDTIIFERVERELLVQPAAPLLSPAVRS